MQKSKKSLRGKKPTVVFLYGPIAVGKLTVAKILSRKLGYKLIHNHLVNDLVEEVFERKTYWNHAMKDYLRLYVQATAVKGKINFVATHAYSHNFISLAGLSDPRFVQILERRLTKLGARFCPVHLKADKHALLKRVTGTSRKRYKKLLDKKILRKLMFEEYKDYDTSPKLKNNFIINNTDLSPQKVANMIIKHYKLRR